MDKKLFELAADIVQSQVSLNKMTEEEVESALIRFYNVLHKMQHAEMEGKSLPMEGMKPSAVSMEPAKAISLDPRSSIQEDKVICLECGAEFRQLTANHLQTHHLTPREYKKKWGFPLKQPLAARVLTRMRSRLAKKRGLPQKLKQYLADRKEKKMAFESNAS
ncbi:MucR family transcriptional regulator [Desulforhabdus amnigena]|jgi:predicted transcriptional regulator|uniref:Transcriptional regulator n=1 Tax=Desulforhabdus amnigena TaxID=40218 RepID=A0A9W6D1N1_9BACT|nr:MucR family transcriptional regulator [Desulforhabdus amnigena]NLJ26575.1 MucR family transcriptional regulator [Deltaproteobacteria bacterium]GLI32607.1 transcriptional regulator [Desulforhabdus amnigena]